MFEDIRKAMFIGLGAAAMSWDKMKEMVDDLVSKGDITADEGKKLYNELLHRAEEQGREANDRLRTQIRQVLTDMGVADRAHIATLESRIESLERRINQLEMNLQTAELHES